MPSSTHLRQDAANEWTGTAMDEDEFEAVVSELLNAHGKEQDRFGME